MHGIALEPCLIVDQKVDLFEHEHFRLKSRGFPPLVETFEGTFVFL